MQTKSYLIFHSRQELFKTLLSFLALFCLLVSYYLVKPLRNSLFLSAFSPQMLPYAFLITALASFLLTRVYTQFYGRVAKARLMIGTYGLTSLILLLFHFALSTGEHLITAAFYVFASVYFLLAIALIWALINDTFLSAEGERCYGYVAMGATLGGIAGSTISEALARTALSDMPLLVASVLTLLALFLILWAHRLYAQPIKTQSSTKAKPSMELLADLKLLLQKPYIKAIGVMVFSLAFFNTNMEFVIQTTVDDAMAQEQFEAIFGEVGVSLSFIRGLRKLKTEERSQALQKQSETLGIENLAASYSDYLRLKEIKTRSFFSEVFKWQGIVSIFVLSFLVRPLFSKLGVAVAVMVLPVICLLATGLMATGPALSIISVLMVVVGSLNYSLNNATKELLFTAADDEDRFRLKPLIEGPLMRFGDVSASVSKLGLAAILSSAGLIQGVLFVAVVIMIGYWMLLARFAGKTYQSRRVSPA